MALGDSYATPGELEDRTGAADPGTYTVLLAAASREVERFTRRQFNQTTTASPRRFRAVDSQRLPVDDFHTTTDLAVTVDGTAWDTANVDPRPWDGIVDGQTGWPYFDLFAVDRWWPWDRRATITVEAQWGWAAVPAGIKQATLDVATLMTTGTGGSYPVRAESQTVDDFTRSVTYQVPGGGFTGNEVPAEMLHAVPYRRKRWGVA